MPHPEAAKASQPPCNKLIQVVRGRQILRPAGAARNLGSVSPPRTRVSAYRPRPAPRRRQSRRHSPEERRPDHLRDQAARSERPVDQHRSAGRGVGALGRGRRSPEPEVLRRPVPVGRALPGLPHGVAARPDGVGARRRRDEDRRAGGRDSAGAHRIQPLEPGRWEHWRRLQLRASQPGNALDAERHRHIAARSTTHGDGGVAADDARGRRSAVPARRRREREPSLAIAGTRCGVAQRNQELSLDSGSPAPVSPSRPPAVGFGPAGIAYSHEQFTGELAGQSASSCRRAAGLHAGKGGLQDY